MDNWTLLSAGFDVGEEADGGSRTTATPWESGGRGGAGQVGLMRVIGGERRNGNVHICKKEEQGPDEIKEKHNSESGKGRDRCLNSDWSLNIYLCLPTLRGEMAV
ncbi:hypothetical protein ABVT39_019073 [Epinephelus coioides]